MLTYDPYYKPAKAYRTSNEAFRDAEYAGYMEYGERNPYSFTPYFVAALTLLGIIATIATYFIYS